MADAGVDQVNLCTASALYTGITVTRYNMNHHDRERHGRKDVYQ